MFYSRNPLSRETKLPVWIDITLFISVISAAFNMTGSDDFDIARREVLLRRIEHVRLLRSGAEVEPAPSKTTKPDIFISGFVSIHF